MNITHSTPIAIVGVSSDVQKYGHKIFHDLFKAGYNVKGVNPKGGEVAKQKIYTSLDKVTPLPELVIFVVPPVVTLGVVKKCIVLGIKQIWMQPGSESDEAIKLAEENHLKVTSNACFMVREKIW